MISVQYLMARDGELPQFMQHELRHLAVAGHQILHRDHVRHRGVGRGSSSMPPMIRTGHSPQADVIAAS